MKPSGNPVLDSHRVVLIKFIKEHGRGPIGVYSKCSSEAERKAFLAFRYIRENAPSSMRSFYERAVKTGSLEKNIPLSVDKIESNFNLLGYFLESNKRRPQLGSDSVIERKLANFVYRMSSSKNEVYKNRLDSLLFRNGFFIKDVKRTDDILSELEEFMIRHHRFPLSSFPDEKRLFDRAFSYVNKGNNADAVSKIEELVVLYDVANTCTLFSEGIDAGISHDHSDESVFSKEFFSPVLARDISTGVVKVPGLTAKYESGSFVLSKKGLPDTVVPPEGIYLVTDGQREYFALEDKSGRLSEIKKSPQLHQSPSLPLDLMKQLDAHIHINLVPGKKEDTFKTNCCLDSVDFTLFMREHDVERSSVVSMYSPYAGDSLIFCRCNSSDEVGSCARQFLSQLPDEYLGTKTRNAIPICLNIDIDCFSKEDWIAFFGHLDKAGVRLSGIVSDGSSVSLTSVKFSGKCPYLDNVELNVSCSSGNYRAYTGGFYGFPHLYSDNVIDSYLGIKKPKPKQFVPKNKSKVRLSL